MKTRFVIRAAAAAFSAAALSLGAHGAFEKTNTYAHGQFKDIKEDAWYVNEVASAYELGFMNGTAEDLFSPDGNVTVAQGITMAARVNAAYYGENIPVTEQGSWYDGYVKYALDKGIIAQSTFESFERSITREEMACLFADALPKEEYNKINDVQHIPDVIEGCSNAEKILMLYNAGIVMGSDDYGTFNPDSDIKRSESAAIINRVALPQNRLTRILKEYTAKDAYQLVYTDGTYDNMLVHNESTRENIVSGWRLDNRGGTERTSIEQTIGGISDVSETEGTALIRDLNKISDEKVTAEFSALLNGEGAYVDFRDENDNVSYCIKIVDGNLALLNKDGTYTSLIKATDKSLAFRVTLDFTTGKANTIIDGTHFNSVDLLSDNIMSFRFGVDEKGTGAVVPGFVNITANYGVYEIFDLFGVEEAYGWTTTGNVSVADGELVMSQNASAHKRFDKIDVKYIAEMLAIFPDGEDAGFKLMNGEGCAVELKSENGSLVANGRTVYSGFTKNMWYRLRVEANPSSGKAEIIINGRSMGMVALNNAEGCDAIIIESSNGKARFDDIKVYANVDHYDYVPKPYTKASLDDYIVAINVCSLWRDNGSHYGWASITPYDQNKPVLGYYDEGSPETADWEIKYMVEHGIDVQALCWYGNVSEGPLKQPRNSYHLHDGIQLSKYDDYMKYCLIWETGGTQKFGSEQFRKYVIPYWFENYFLDDNYFVLDNKLVLHMFGGELLGTQEYFGSYENAKKELEYLNREAKKYGFDGMLYFSNGNASLIEQLGVEASAAYHWGEKGYSYDVNIESNINGFNASQSVYQIPTVTVGYDDRAWRGNAAPLMTVEDYRRTNQWVKSSYLPQYAKKDSWQEKMVWISTWNEYGEGTYIMPSGVNGFGYLDVLREEYTQLDVLHTDLVPTPEQAKRIQRLYPQHARLLRREGVYTIETEQTVIKTLEFDPAQVVFNNVGDTIYFDGDITGVSTGEDFNVNFLDLSGCDLSEITGIKFTMKSVGNNRVDVFFGTDSDPSFNAAKSFSAPTHDGYNEYVFDCSSHPAWTGYLTGLRIDPANGNGIEFNIQPIQLISEVSDKSISMNSKLNVNSYDIKSVVYAEKLGDELLFPFDPETAVDHIMHTLMTWDREDGRLTLEAKGHKVQFTVGSDRYVSDGVEKELGYELYTRDGLPMLNMKIVCDALGFDYRLDGKTAYITTVDKTENDGKTNIEWDFNSYDTESWESFNTKLFANGSQLVMNNESDTNPLMVLLSSPKLGFSAMKYNKLELRIKYKYDSASNDFLKLYFITSLDNVWNEAKSCTVTFKSTNSADSFEVYTLDLSSVAAWNGIITGLRIDPFNTSGIMELDYIRFICDENYDESKDPMAGIDLNACGIINGDGENPMLNPFTHQTTTVRIVEDELNSENHAFEFSGPDTKAWTYAVHPFEFDIGKTYKVSFDARAVSDSKGKAVSLDLGVLFKYPSSEGTDHFIGTLKLPEDGSWQHFEMEYTVSKISSNNNASFACYASPPSESTSGVFLMDNLCVTEVE